MNISSIKNICNLGAGTMGCGTAVAFGMAGYNVKIFARSQASIERALATIHASLEAYANQDLIKQQDIPLILNRIKGVTTLEDAAFEADFVIESVAENLSVKQEVFKRMEQLCRPDTIFATNTSGLSPTSIAKVLERQDRFIVTHFWNPAHLIPLVEVVPGKNTTQATVDLTWALIEKIGKKPVALQREALGFIGNRLQYALLREALYIVESGIATKEAVDTTVKYSLGRRLSTTGPLESADLGGLDVFNDISSYLLPDLCNSTDVPALLRQAVEQGKFGAKTGSGLYEWTPEELAALKKYREINLLEWLQKDKLAAKD